MTAGPPLGGRLPRALAGGCEVLACLKQAPSRSSFLLRDGTGRQLVLKWSQSREEDLEEEARLLKELDGQGLPAVYGSGQEEGRSWLLREYVPGETLLDYAQKRGPLPAAEAAQIGLALCRTLKSLHRQSPPVIHRDVKAENIIRTPEGRYVLIDFGIARRYDSGARRDTQVLGTPASAPPEQFGYRQTDPRSDVYAVGVLLHQLTTGETSLERGAPPRALAPVIARCTQFDPKGRFPNAAALERALSRMEARGRFPARLRLAALLAVPLLAALLWAMGRRPSSPPAHEQPYAFASAAIEAEVCLQLGKEPGTVTLQDLDAIQRILLCGTGRFDRWEQLSAYGQEVQIDSIAIGSQGGVDTLADIPQFQNLRELALCNQNISDLSPLAGCGVERLALHGNPVTDLTALGDCPQLRELDLSGTPVSDLGTLARCPALWKLNAGGTQLETVDSLVGAPALGTLLLHDCPRLADVSALTELAGLNTLQLRPVTAEQLEVVRSLTGLNGLFLWQVEGMTDLTALSGLTGLGWLFVHTDALASLEGVEALTALEFLDVRSPLALDLRPLAGLPTLKTMNTVGLSPTDWAPLAELPALEQVYCLPEQEGPIRRALGDRAVQIN